MIDHMIKTTKEWQSTSMFNKIIERGTLCIEITVNDEFFAKVGDGRRSYKNLPYLFQSSFEQLTSADTSLMELIQNGLNERYTKEEVDAIEHQLMELIQNIDLSNYVTNNALHEYTQSFTPEEKEKLASLENADLSGLDARVTALEEIDHSLYATEEYVDEKIENLDITVDLSDYATITYVDEKIAAIDIPSIDLSMYATKSWVSTQIENIPGMDLTGYATEQYVDDAIAAIQLQALPIATASTLGGVKIGEGVNISQDGTISVAIPEIPVIPQYTAGKDISIDYVDTSSDLTLFTWSQGGLSDATGYEDDTVENMIRLDGFLPIPNETPINVSLTYQQTIPLYWKMFFYDDNQTMLGHTEWMTNEDGVNPVTNTQYLRIIAYQGTSDSLDPRLLTYGEISPEVDVDKYVISNTYELPIASADTLGGVKVGEDLVIDENGVLNIADIHRLILNVTE